MFSTVGYTLGEALEADAGLGYPGYDFNSSPRTHFEAAESALTCAYCRLLELLRDAARAAAPEAEAASTADGSQLARHAERAAKVAEDWLHEDLDATCDWSAGSHWRACVPISVGICIEASARVLKLLADGLQHDGGHAGPRGRPVIFKVAFARGVNIRSEPSTSSSVVGRLPLGHHVMGWPFGHWLELQAVESWVPPSAEALAAGYTAPTLRLLERYALIDGSHLGQGCLLTPVARYRGRLSSVQHKSERPRKFKDPRAPAGRSHVQLEEDTHENEENDELPHETDFNQCSDDQLSSDEVDADFAQLSLDGS
jgi:hypothetical protein